jgi:formylmethanofuran dehydrogenase subunit A
MAEYLIKNGFVFDPAQKIKGDVADVAIKDGKIVKSVENPKVIDAKGMTVMAGALEVHAHVAGPKVNIGRIFRPEDKLFTYRPTEKNHRMEGGFSIPTTYKTGYAYARLHHGHGSGDAAALCPACP